MRPRNMELAGLLLRNTDVVGGKPRFWAPNPEPPKHFRTPRHYDNGGKMPCNLEAETKSKVGTAHRPGSPWRRMTIPMALTDELWPSHLKLRPSHCQITMRQSPCLWQITLALEITTLALSSYDPPVPLSVTHYDPHTWNYDPCALKLRPANPLSVTD